MPIKAGRKYAGVVTPGSSLIESQSGSLGYQVQLECEDGETSYTIWLTPKTRENARECFEKALGVDPKKLEDGNYIEMQLALDIDGREVSFTTKEEEYKGKFKVKVSGLYRRSASNGVGLAKAAGSFFKGTGLTPGADKGITDDDIPFRFRSVLGYNQWHEEMYKMSPIKTARSLLRPRRNG